MIKGLKSSSSNCSENLKALFNKTLQTGNIPIELKFVDSSPVLKQENPSKLKSYRLVSLLPVLLKITEMLINEKMRLFVNNFFFPC